MASTFKTPRNCEHCGVTYIPRKPNQRFCTPAHGRLAYYARYAEGEEPRRPLSSATRGAVSEMVVACDLMERGYEVFRALSPACSCDLIAMPPSRIPVRIEVRTGKRNAVTGTTSFARNTGTQARTPRRAVDDLDHYAVVVGNEIRYIPELPAVEQASAPAAQVGA